jgi:actin related protein 2/3 complex, subunit 2
MAWQCYKDLEKYGAAAVLKREYGVHVVAALPGFDVTLSVDLQKLPADRGFIEIIRTYYQIICFD